MQGGGRAHNSHTDEEPGDLSQASRGRARPGSGLLAGPGLLRALPGMPGMLGRPRPDGEDAGLLAPRPEKKRESFCCLNHPAGGELVKAPRELNIELPKYSRSKFVI